MQNASLQHLPQIKSVSVPFGFQLELYEDNQYLKPKEVIRPVYNDIYSMGCHDISSIDFTNIGLRKLKDTEAEGHWVQSKYNGRINNNMQVGFYSADGFDSD